MMFDKREIQQCSEEKQELSQKVSISNKKSKLFDYRHLGSELKNIC